MRLSEKAITKTLKKNMTMLTKYRVKNKNFSGYFDNYLCLRSTLQNLLKSKFDLVINDMISHYIKPLMYFGINYNMVWDIVENQAPGLKSNIQEVLFEIGKIERYAEE